MSSVVSLMLILMYKQRISLFWLTYFFSAFPLRCSCKDAPDLQKKISEILAKPELASAMIGIKVVSLDTGKVIFEETRKTHATRFKHEALHSRSRTRSPLA